MTVGNNLFLIGGEIIAREMCGLISKLIDVHFEFETTLQRLQLNWLVICDYI